MVPQPRLRVKISDLQDKTGILDVGRSPALLWDRCPIKPIRPTDMLPRRSRGHSVPAAWCRTRRVPVTSAAAAPGAAASPVLWGRHLYLLEMLHFSQRVVKMKMRFCFLPKFSGSSCGALRVPDRGWASGPPLPGGSTVSETTGPAHRKCRLLGAPKTFRSGISVGRPRESAFRPPSLGVFVLAEVWGYCRGPGGCHNCISAAGQETSREETAPPRP